MTDPAPAAGNRLWDRLIGAGKDPIVGVPLAAALRALHREQRTCVLAVRSGAHQGHLGFAEGELVGAASEDALDEEAVRRMLAWPNPEFRVDGVVVTGWRIIRTPLAELLPEVTDPAPPLPPEPTADPPVWDKDDDPALTLDVEPFSLPPEMLVEPAVAPAALPPSASEAAPSPSTAPDAVAFDPSKSQRFPAVPAAVPPALDADQPALDPDAPSPPADEPAPAASAVKPSAV